MIAENLRPGEKVRITTGELAGRRALVVRQASWRWANTIPLYDLDVDGVATIRTVPAHHLKPVR